MAQQVLLYKQILADRQPFMLVPITQAIWESAASLRARLPVRLPDAVHLTAARQSGSRRALRRAERAWRACKIDYTRPESKPRWMRWPTFERLTAEADAAWPTISQAETALDGAEARFKRRIDRLERRIDRLERRIARKKSGGEKNPD